MDIPVTSGFEDLQRAMAASAGGAVQKDGPILSISPCRASIWSTEMSLAPAM